MRSLFLTCLLVLSAIPAAEAQRAYDCGPNGCPGSGGNNGGGNHPRPLSNNGGGNWGGGYGHRPQVPNYPPPVPRFWPQHQQPQYQQPNVTQVTLCGWDQVWNGWGYQTVQRCYAFDTRPGYDVQYRQYLSIGWTIRLF